MNVEINPSVLAELEYLVELHGKHGAPNPVGSVEDLVEYVLDSIADGSRRPGSWERELLNMMGLVANTPEHAAYRSEYGRPK
jgi:hypothetical protein